MIVLHRLDWQPGEVVGPEAEPPPPPVPEGDRGGGTLGLLVLELGMIIFLESALALIGGFYIAGLIGGYGGLLVMDEGRRIFWN